MYYIKDPEGRFQREAALLTPQTFISTVGIVWRLAVGFYTPKIGKALRESLQGTRTPQQAWHCTARGGRQGRAVCVCVCVKCHGSRRVCVCVVSRIRQRMACWGGGSGRVAACTIRITRRALAFVMAGSVVLCYTRHAAATTDRGGKRAVQQPKPRCTATAQSLDLSYTWG